MDVEQVNYGVHVFLPAWCSIAIPRYLGELLRMNRDHVSDMVPVLAAPPFELIAGSRFQNFPPKKEEVLSFIKSGLELSPNRISFSDVSLQTLTDAVDFLAMSGIKWIDRPYRPRTGYASRVWGGYTLEAVRHNVRSILVQTFDSYRLVVQRNRIPLHNSVCLRQARAIIYATDLSKWANADGDKNHPLMDVYCVENGDGKLPNVVFVDRSEGAEDLKVEKKFIRFNNLERKLIYGHEISGADLFQDLPTLKRVYEMLQQDLHNEFPRHYF